MIDAQGNYVPEPIQKTEAVPTLNIDPSAVYSASNINQASTSPVAPPNLGDPMGLYDYYLNSGDIQGAQQSLKTINEQYNKARATSRAQQTAIENIPRESMSFIGTAQQRAGTLANQQLQALSESKMAQQSYIDTLQSKARDKFNIANQQRAQLQDLIAQTGGRAGISYTDTYEQAVKKADKYQEKKTKEEAEKAKKDAYKQSLKDTYTQLKGYAPKAMSTSELEKKVKKLSKGAVEEAKKLADLEYQIKLKALNKPDYKPDSDSEMQPEIVIDQSTGDAFETGNMVSVGTPTKFVKLDTNQDPSFEDTSGGGFWSGLWGNVKSWF